MRLRLKEEPREWLKFTASTGVMFGLLWTLGRWKQWHTLAVWAGFIPGCMAVIACWLHPRLFRGYYRMGMRFFHFIGRRISTLALSVFFFGCLTPMAWMLRFMGKDLLKIQRPDNIKTNWESPRSSGGHDKMF